VEEFLVSLLFRVIILDGWSRSIMLYFVGMSDFVVSLKLRIKSFAAADAVDTCFTLTN